MNSRLLTLDRLVQLRACNGGRLTFQRVFGSQVEVTPERFSQPDVIEAEFDYDWAVDALLPEPQREAYCKELRARKDVIRSERGLTFTNQIPWEERKKIEAILWAEFYVAYGLDTAPPEPIAPCDTVEPLDVEEDEDDEEVSYGN